MGRRPVLPSADQVDQLPAELKRVVPPEFEDLNGHMSIRHYFDLQTTAVAELSSHLRLVRRTDRSSMAWRS